VIVTQDGTPKEPNREEVDALSLTKELLELA